MCTLVGAAGTLATALLGAALVTAQTLADPMTRELVPLGSVTARKHFRST